MRKALGTFIVVCLTLACGFGGYALGTVAKSSAPSVVVPTTEAPSVRPVVKASPTKARKKRVKTKRPVVRKTTQQARPLVRKTRTTKPTQRPTRKSVYYANCDAVRRAGAAPIRVGDPGYRSGLDRDGDGQGCGDD